MSTFQVTVPRIYTFEEGWGVDVTPIWEGEDDDGNISERISEIIVSVVEIREDAVRIIGDVPCVQVEEHAYVPIENFRRLDDLTQGDTHDLRDRWFATEEEAQEHARYTRERWENPSPWESFVRTS